MAAKCSAGATNTRLMARGERPCLRVFVKCSRRVASRRLIVTTGLEACLVAYPLREWEAFEERLSRLPSFDPSVAMLKRIYVSGAIECDLDKLGRLLLPSSLA